MRYQSLIVLAAVSLVAAHPSAAQEPTTPTSLSQSAPNEAVNAAAITGSKQDPAAVARGGTAFRTYCAGCHGVAANGGPGAPDLVRSLLVLDDEKGILIAPVIREGRPDRGMPKINVSEPQIADLVAWLHARTYAAGHRLTYSFVNTVTGDSNKGKQYFNSTGGCNSCHSVTGDLAGIGGKHQPVSLQTLWLQPRGERRGGGAPKSADKATRKVTVTAPSGQSFTGTLDRIDDFTVSLRDANGRFHSFSRDGESPVIVVNDPLKAHEDMLPKYTDEDIHNVTAYLATLK